MKFPGGEYVRRIRKALARRRTQETAASKLRHDCADKLRPYIGRLILVTNFQGVWVEEDAAHIRDAVLTPAHFGAEMSIGISAVLSYERKNKNHEQLIETAAALKDSFASRIGERAFSAGPQYGRSSLWLSSLARAAEDITARRANVPPQELGCIAAVSALDMYRQADLPGVPRQGSAFKLAHINEQAGFVWEMVAKYPDMWGTQNEMGP